MNNSDKGLKAWWNRLIDDLKLGCNKLVDSFKGWWKEPYFKVTFIGSAAVVLLLLLSALLNPKKRFDVVGVNVGASNISDAKAYFDNWYVSWGYLGSGAGHAKTHVGVYFRPPSVGRVVWMHEGRKVERQVKISGQISRPRRPYELPAIVIEVDAECGRARGAWQAKYEGTMHRRAVTNAAPDCSAFDDVAYPVLLNQR